MPISRIKLSEAMTDLQRCAMAEKLAWTDARPRTGAEMPFTVDEAQRTLRVWRRKKSELDIAIERTVLCHRALTTLD